MVYGTDVNWIYDEHDPEHVHHSSKKYLDLAGVYHVRGGFYSILLKVKGLAYI
jgi:hypothetical protein